MTKSNYKNYNGWLVSDSFLKRCLAVVGHYSFGALIILVIWALIFMLIELIKLSIG